MQSHLNRRQMLALTGKAALVGALAPGGVFAKEERSQHSFGAIVGEPVAVKVGEKFLADGGNAIDAAIATAFAAGITSPSKCGVGGYGGHAIIAMAGGKKIRAIDFNSAAPMAAREDMFPLDAKGNVKNKLNMHGWLAAAVPGTLAGLELALSRYGTRSLRDVLAPTIQLCEEGVAVAAVSEKDLSKNASRNDASPESFAASGNTPKQQNLPLARMLKTLAARNSGDSFYRGDIARTIAESFRKGGGLVTMEDLAAYNARDVEPLKIEWNGSHIYTPPLTAPGLSYLEAISILKTLGWHKLSSLERLHAKLEAMRIAWADRLAFFGDPETISVPVERLLSQAHAEEMAEMVRVSLKQHQPVPLTIDASADEGTMNISAVDRHGNMIAITLTHGSGFGARVSVEEFGMVLGHGMWRFDPRPGKPNSVGPGKRCVNNMCPAAIVRDGKPVFAVGAAGGTRIPNSIYEVLLNVAGLGLPLEKAMAAARLQTTGTLKLEIEKHQDKADEAFLRKNGYNISTAISAYTSAVSYDLKTKECRGMSRGGVS